MDFSYPATKSRTSLRRHEEPMRNLLLLPIISGFVVLSGTGMATPPDVDSVVEEGIATSDSDEEVLITLRAPLMSPLFAKTPVALVNDEPITFHDLTRRIFSIHKGAPTEATSSRKDYAALLERVVTTKLIVQEARNIGLDEMPGFQSQVEEMSKNLLISGVMSRQLETVKADPAEVDELYKKMSREFLLSTVNFRNEEDARSFKEQLEAGENFADLARRFSEEEGAEIQFDSEEYLKLKDLLPRIGAAVFDMEVGSVSEIFSTSQGFVLFRVEDARFYEDAGVKEEAREKVLRRLRKEAAAAYADRLEEDYSTIDEKLLKHLDFEKEKTGFLSLGKEKPVDFRKFLEDDRVVATVHDDPPFTVTVADLAKAVEESFFHGIETAVERKKELNREKRIKLKNILFERIVVMEARRQGLDQTTEYSDAMEDFEDSLLFEAFVKKVVAPRVKITEQEVHRYFEEHIGDFSSPKMFRMNGLVFYTSSDATKALEKLRNGADFRWVSANSPGQVKEGTSGVLDFHDALLSLTALPEDLRKDADRAQRGDALLYSGPNDFYYVIAVEKVFPAAPQKYETARGAIAKSIAAEKTRIAIDDWSEKLREAYETKIFVTGLDD
jgi:hypothetical protein